ncbi:MAG TPA: rod shape-determining protein MreC [Acidimicrobiia bacterium]|nr:rod shape-determining protein MreC [Acidimicrobiia bacterium]
MTVKKRVVLLLCITALTLITIDLRGGASGPLGAVRSAVREVFSPMQRGVNAVTSPVGNFVDGIVNASDLKKENTRLRREVTKVKTKNKTYEAAVGENDRLRKLLKLTKVIDIDNTTAHVITGSPSNFETTLQIDKGTDSKVRVGDAVIDGDGLVGRIIDVSTSRSTVLLITDSTSGVGVRDARSEITGIAQGQAGDSDISMQFVDPDADIKNGDTVVTSGLQDGRFPPDIPVATVKSAKRNPSGLYKDVKLTPIVNINRISVVSVLHTSKAAAK